MAPSEIVRPKEIELFPLASLRPVETNPRYHSRSNIAKIGASKRGDSVYDPFMGSGTTIIAAETSARSALGVEINPSYVDMAVLRWEAFTGKRARLEASNQTLEEVKECRLKDKVA